METLSHVVRDQANWWTPADPSESPVVSLLESRGVIFTTVDGWHYLDQYELGLGAAAGHTRIKVVERDEMVAVSNQQPVG